MEPLYGVHAIAKNGQVVIPKAVMQAAGLHAGDGVYFLAVDRPPGGVLLLRQSVIDEALREVVQPYVTP